MKKIFEHFLYSYLIIMSQLMVTFSSATAAENLPGVNSQWMEDNALDPDSIASLKYAIQLCKEKKIDQIQDAVEDKSQAGGLKVGSMVIPCAKLLEKEPELTKLVSNAEAINAGAADPDEASNNNDFTHCVYTDGEYKPMTENQFIEFQKLQGHVAEMGSEAQEAPSADGSPKKVCPAGAPFKCSLFEGLDSGCARKFLSGIWENIKSNAELAAELAKMVGSWAWDGLKAVGNFFSGLSRVENNVANKAHIASHVTKAEVDKEKAVRKEDPAKKNESPFAWVKRKLGELVDHIWDSSVELYACLEKDPVTNQCLAVPKNKECTPCNHYVNVFCGMGGYIAGEVLSTLLLGGALRAAGMIAKAVKGSRLAKPLVAIGSKGGSLLGKTGKMISKTKSYRIGKVYIKKGLKQAGKYLDKAKVAGGKSLGKVTAKLGSIAGVKILGRTAYFVIVLPLKKYFQALNMAFEIGLKGTAKARAGWAATKAAKAGNATKATEVATEVAKDGTEVAARDGATLSKIDNASAVKSTDKAPVSNGKTSSSTSSSGGGSVETPKRPIEGESPRSSVTSTNESKTVSTVEEKNGNLTGETTAPKTSTTEVAPKAESGSATISASESHGGGGAAPTGTKKGGSSGGGSFSNSSSDFGGAAGGNGPSSLGRSTQTSGTTTTKSEPLIGLNKDSELIQKYKAKNEYKDYFNDLVDPKDHGKIARKIEELEKKFGHDPDELFKQIHSYRNSLVNELSKYKNDLNYKKYFEIVTDTKDQELLAFKIRELENSFGLNNPGKILSGVEDYLKQDKFLPYKMEYTSKLKSKLKGQFDSTDSYKVLDVDRSMLSKEDLLAKKAKALNQLEDIPEMNLRNKWTSNVEKSFDKINQEQQFIAKAKENKTYEDIFARVPYEKEGKLAKTIEFLEAKHQGNPNAIMKELKEWSKRDQIVDEKIVNRMNHTRDYKPFRDATKGAKEKRMLAKHIDELETKFQGNRGKVIEELKKEQALKNYNAEKINPRVEFDQYYFNSIKNRPEFSEHFLLVKDGADQKKLASQIVELEKRFPNNPQMVKESLDKYMGRELGTVRLEKDSVAKAATAPKNSAASIFDDTIVIPAPEITRLKESEQFKKYFQSMARTPADEQDLAKVIKELERKHQGNAKLIQDDLTTLENKFMKDGCKVP